MSRKPRYRPPGKKTTYDIVNHRSLVAIVSLLTCFLSLVSGIESKLGIIWARECELGTKNIKGKGDRRVRHRVAAASGRCSRLWCHVIGASLEWF